MLRTLLLEHPVRTMVLLVLLVVEFVNVLTFYYARLLIPIGDSVKFYDLYEFFGKEGAGERYFPENEDADVVNFLIAGMFNQPKAAFQEILPSGIRGRICTMSYDLMGWKADDMANYIRCYIDRYHPEEVVIWTISVGDHVARKLEYSLASTDNVKIIAINPCSDPRVLQSELRGQLKIVDPFARVVRLLGGWVSYFPVFSDSGGYSWALASDQLHEMMQSPTEIPKTTLTKAVVVSTHDQFLDNWAIVEYEGEPERNITSPNPYFHDVIVRVVDTAHGETIRDAGKYREALEEIWAEIQ